MPRAIGEWKVCCKCKEKKHVSKFNKSKSRLDGYEYSCRKCANARIRDYKSKNRELLRQKDKEYRNTERGRYNAKMRMRKWRKNPENAEKNREQAKAYYHEHKKERTEYVRNYRKTPHGRRKLLIYLETRRKHIKNSVVDLHEYDIIFLLEFQKHRCGKCGRKFSSSLKYSLDHILPLSLGGNLTLDNVQLLCRPCNSTKGATTVRYIDELETYFENWT